MVLNFNSCMVRLKEVVGTTITSANIDFNSCMVRLKVANPIGAVLAVIVFQFLYGTIKGNAHLQVNGSSPDFNSCMVRLKVAVS